MGKEKIMKKKILSLLGVSTLMLSMTLTGCGEKKEIQVTERQETTAEEVVVEETEVPDDGKFHGKWVVDVSYAAGRVGAEDTLFVDGRGEKQTILGTIEGAVATVWQDWATQEGKQGDENWGCVQDADTLAETLGALGITKEKEIIVLGETLDGWGDDARLVWELLAAGYTDVKMVDGGYRALKEYGAATQFFASKPKAAEVQIDEIDDSHIMTTEELQNDYDDYVIVDVRTQEEYDGAILYGEVQGGHLPGAIHIEYLDLFKEDGTLKSNKELIQMFEDAGLDEEDQIVTYCTGGIRSAYMQLVLEMCGFENSYNYDQSFWRWAVVGKVE